jgi:hypothetical protein
MTAMAQAAAFFCANLCHLVNNKKKESGRERERERGRERKIVLR